MTRLEELDLVMSEISNQDWYDLSLYELEEYDRFALIDGDGNYTYFDNCGDLLNYLRLDN